mmetsp:Transcript_37876/g.97747  ORF Transcript_37876/g.97747 Transcript_37876/m.97747 type:complete len:226 (-) Transcript_37876:603-1280(-)
MESVPSLERKAFIIGIAGGTASGKTTICQNISKLLEGKSVQIISMDSFYRDLQGQELEAAARGDHDFDSPASLDWEAMHDVLGELKSGKPSKIPQYDFKTHTRCAEWLPVEPAQVILIEGILTFHDPKLRDEMDVKLFVDTDADIRLLRRLKRDLIERGRDIMGVIHQYERFVKPAYDIFVEPTKRFADVIIPYGKINDVAVDFIHQHILSKLRSFQVRRSRDSI